MKKTTIKVALFMVLVSMAVSCQKETITEPTGIVADAQSVYLVHYSIGGEHYQATLYSEAEYTALMHRLMALAREGYEVSIADGNCASQTATSKKTVVYTTRSEEDAINTSSMGMLKKPYLEVLSSNSSEIIR